MIGNDPLVEVGIRKKADHASGSARQQLLAGALQLFLQMNRRRVGFRELVFDEFALRDIRSDFPFGSQIKSESAVNLFQGEGRVMSPGCQTLWWPSFRRP